MAAANIPDSDGVITGYYRTSDGTLRVIDIENGQTCKKNETTLPWNQEGPTGPPGTPATLPAGTLTGAQMVVGSIAPSDFPGNSEFSVTCPGGKVAVAGVAWIQLEPPLPVREAPILLQLADGQQFRSTVEVDWSLYFDQVTPESRISWNVTCAFVSS